MGVIGSNPREDRIKDQLRRMRRASRVADERNAKDRYARGYARGLAWTGDHGDWPDSIDHPRYVQGFKDGYLSTRRNDHA